MDANRARNMYSDNKPSETKAASRWLLTNTIFIITLAVLIFKCNSQIYDLCHIFKITDFLTPYRDFVPHPTEKM